jgi:antitoxin HigA-1
MLPKNRTPTHPGEMLLEEFLKPIGMSQRQLANHLGWTYAKLNELIHGKRGVTPETALDLGDAFNIEPDF